MASDTIPAPPLEDTMPGHIPSHPAPAAGAATTAEVVAVAREIVLALQGLRDAVREHGERLSALDARLATVERRLDALEGAVRTLSTEVIREAEARRHLPCGDGEGCPLRP